METHGLDGHRYIIVPELGMAHEPVRLSAWLVRCGERVEADEPVLSSPAAGVLVRKLAGENELLTPGQPVALVRVE